jgi:glycosyltransferase involved in cell wall biosynthesis
MLSRLRAETRSTARVELRCETWEEAQIAALHSRGDCYLSLHRVEGWCYPLFEAACRAKAMVATRYSGPLDYLDPSAHFLVRYRLAPVGQRLRYYHADMLWAEPDVSHAAECLRVAYEGRDTLPSKTSAAAERIRRKYSVEEIGRLAAQRLVDLLAAPPA